VRQCRDVSFILDHIGKPDIANGEIEMWRKHITTLAGFENVWCKLSGIITEADHQMWTREQLRPYIEHVIASFGMERVMFGSDWPVVNLAGSYKRWLDALLWATGHLSKSEQQQLFLENAGRFYSVS
jgi:L-fuconolactonase